MPADRPQAFRFGPFRLSVADRVLDRAGARIPLTPKVIDTLFVLLEHAPHVVTKEELMAAVWPGLTVVESGLTRNISSLRKALEEGAAEGSYLETIPKRGYRFVAQVIQESTGPAHQPEPAPTPPPRRTSARPWIALAAAATTLALAWLLLKPASAPQPAQVDPSVRIGEHLLYKLAPEETVRASAHFEQAVAVHPNSAAAHAGLSIALVQIAMFGIKPVAELMPRAEQAARRALALDPASSPAHYAAGLLAFVKDWDFARSEAEFRRALELDPTSVQVRFGYAHLKLARDGPAAALPLAEEALRLDPASPPLGAEYCRLFYFQRDYRRAESECRKVLDREPAYALARYYLALSLGYLNRIDEARRMLDLSGLSPGVVEADQAWLSLLAGDRRPALQALERRRTLIRQHTVDPTAKLLLAASLGLLDEAREALEAGLATRAPEMLTAHLEPRLDPLRGDPQCAALLNRIRRLNQ